VTDAELRIVTEAELHAIERMCESLMDSDVGPPDGATREILVDWETMLDIIEQVVPRLIAEVRRLGGSAGIAEAGLALRREAAEQWGEGDATAAFDATLRQVMSAVEAGK
jgi:hypothetical protein